MAVKNVVLDDNILKTVSTKTQVKDDALALAQLIYDVFTEEVISVE